MFLVAVVATLLITPLHAEDLADSVPDPVPYAQIHIWATAWDQDSNPTTDPAGYGDPEDDTGFKVRRVRAGVTGEADSWRYRLGTGMTAPYDGLTPRGGKEMEVESAWIGYKPLDSVWLTAGYQEVPVSREALMSSQELVLAERSVAGEWVAPNRDVGVIMDHQSGDRIRTRINLGAFNGNESVTGDHNTGLLFAGRAEVVIGPGDVYSTVGAVSETTFAFAFDGWRDDDVATNTTGLGADVMFRHGGLSVSAEGRGVLLAPAGSDLDQPDVLSETKRMGAHGQVSYSPTAFESAHGGVEIAARFGVFDDDMDVDDNGDVGEVMGGVTWSGYDNHVRFGGGYVHRMEFGGVGVGNDTVRFWWLMKI